MLGGYMNRILRVDLCTGTLKEEPLEEELIERFIGGYGLGAKILYDDMRSQVDPLGPDNILGFCTGPLTGTPVIEGNRYMVVCKSPLTGGWGDSNCGGTFGPYMKFAGFDAVFFRGIAASPQYLIIDDGIAQLMSAEPLWGLDTAETERFLKKAHGEDARVACIGPAGENKSLIAGIIHEGRAAARSGVGAVMGSKNLKAVVVKGTKDVPVLNPKRVGELKRKYLKLSAREYEPLNKNGTIGILSNAIMSGDAPVKNWKGAGPTDLPTGIDNFHPSKIMKYQTRKKGCWRCTIACSGEMEVTEGPFKIKTTKVEYESAAAFGPLIMNDDFDSILYINDLCNRLGFDTISAGTVIAFAMDCTESGLLTDPELLIDWGDVTKTISLLRKMANRKGPAAILTDGVRKASEVIGEASKEMAIHVNGQELPFHDPRFQPGMATTYAVEPTPGRHCPCEWILPPGLDFPEDVERYSPHGKGVWQKRMTCQMQVINASGLCQFGYYSYPVEAWPEFLHAVIGIEYDLAKLEQTGERILNLRHAFNLREGINPLSFHFPTRAIGRPPLQEGNTKGVTVDIETQIADYFKELQWDTKTSYPSDQRLTELDLGFIVEDLYKNKGGEPSVS